MTRKAMTKFQAHNAAYQRWATHGSGPTDRVAVVTLRQKKVPDRCEVGWYARGGGGVVIEGRGPTWEAAFADADKKAGGSRPSKEEK